MRRYNGQPLLSPSDLNDMLECRHLLALRLARFRGEAVPPSIAGAHVDLLVKYGELHEARILEDMKAAGRRVEEITTGADEETFRRAAEQTLAAVRAGVDVIHQATLVGNGVGGYADFLERRPVPSLLGDWSYGVSDAKLARATRTYFLVQLSLYAAILGEIQGHPPDELVVLLGDGSGDTYRTQDFAAYVRRLLHFAKQTIADGLEETYPLPCAHCGICGYRRSCEDRRRRDDHLSLVAGIRSDQVKRLEADRVPTLAALARLAPERRVSRIPHRTLTKLRRQAVLQLQERETNEQVYELLDYQEGFGFNLLPAPASGDLYFDLEGDPYLGESGLVYLFGVGWEEAGTERYEAFWALEPKDEKQAFERLVDFMIAWRARHPGAHIYHYGSIEETKLKQLAMYHATREDDVDRLLRGQALVDLFRVVRQGIRISKESYSLKQVEKFYWQERTAKVKEAGGSIVAFERWLVHRDPEGLEEIRAYNEEDVHSTRGLRDWLLTLRSELLERGDAVEWRPAPSPDAEEIESVDPETKELRERLLARGDESAEQLGELLLYFRREAKPGYWWYHERRRKTDEELQEEDDESIGGLRPDGLEGVIARSRLVPMLFPPQQFKLREGGAVDPFSERPAEIIDIDPAKGTLSLKLSPGKWGSETPRALIPGKPYQTTPQRAALRRIAEDVLDDGGRYPAAEDLLERRYPRITAHSFSAPLVDDGYDVDGAVDLALRLDRSVLPIQGPPGTGKTYAGARIAVALMERGRRVGVTAPSHKAVHNMVEEIERIARERGVSFRGYKRADGDDRYTSPFGDDGSIDNVGNDDCEDPPEDVLLVAGTSWLFAREGMEGVIDTLLIDEAGQYALASALAVSTSARNVVLLGDPQQLSQVSQGTHPALSGLSALEQVLRDDRTMPPRRGLFIHVSRRMHPEVTRFVSEISYAGELFSLPECGNQVVESGGLSGAGLRWRPVDHEGNRRESEEEAEQIAKEVDLLVGGTMTCADGSVVPIEKAGVMVVTPYNSQVRLLRLRLPEWVDVGTVDKFQGREAAVVFFSMATSSGEDIPRNVDFLYSRNRLNVAVSRARCLAVLVASPALLRIRCRTVEQMRLVNALCRFVELAA